ncbi:MAG TPA: polyphenol oxidase family protein [Acidimicrobiales bacterium]|nr:polyphenol oxidase family protein [Acidimicrobiales bacterium]
MGVDGRRRALLDRPWTWLRQVHGADVVTVTRPGEHAGAAADAAVTTDRGAALAVGTADCAPLALAADCGDGAVIAAVHAGWKGLAAGIIEATVATMRAAGAGEIQAALGPCIHAGCYEFGEAELAQVVERAGSAARGVTRSGATALDVPAAVRGVLASVGVDLAHDAGVCTACSSDHWSHRARGDVERQAMVVWLP